MIPVRIRGTLSREPIMARMYWRTTCTESLYSSDRTTSHGRIGSVLFIRYLILDYTGPFYALELPFKKGHLRISDFFLCNWNNFMHFFILQNDSIPYG